MSEAYQSTGEKKYLDKALKILQAIESNLINDNLEVQRSLSSSDNNVIFLEDYSYLISAYISLYQSTFEYNLIDKADKLINKSLSIFNHTESPFLRFSSDQSLLFSDNLFVNQDGVMPSANSVMSKNLFLISHYTGNREYFDIGKSMIDAITNGLIGPNEPLPSSRNLAKALQVARNTVIASYKELEFDGYITPKERRGYFVNEQFYESYTSSDNGQQNKPQSPTWQDKLITKKPSTQILSLIHI